MSQQQVSVHYIHNCIPHSYNNHEALNQGWLCHLPTQHPTAQHLYIWVGLIELWLLTIRQQVLKSFRLELARGLIGNYNSKISLPHFQREGEASVAQQMSLHLPKKDTIKGSTGCCCYCWNVKGRRHDFFLRCRRYEKALCIGIYLQKGPLLLQVLPHPATVASARSLFRSHCYYS